MRPKKKSNFELVVCIILLVLITFVALHAAMAYSTTLGGTEITTYGEHSKALSAFFNSWRTSITTAPFNVHIVAATKKSVFWGFLLWFLGTAYYFTTRRNFIHGKEFGTARWGNLNDIKTLFADTIKTKEMKKVKSLKWFFGRVRAKRKDIKKIKAMFENDRAKIEESYKSKTISKTVKKDRLKALHEEQAEKLNEVKNTEYKLTPSQRADKLIKIEQKYNNADMLFTATERVSIYNYDVNNNTLIVAGSGGGKTRNYAIPNILQAHSSYVITDPKGEILEKTGAFLEKEGYKIRVLNLDAKWLSDGYNPFQYIHPERRGYEERIMLLIETIILNTDDGEKKSSTDPFWDKAEKLFLQAIFFFTVCGFCEEERNMNTVVQLIRMLQISEERDSRDSELDMFAELYKEVVPDGENNIGYQQYIEFRSKASGKTAKSIVITAVARLAPFKVSEIRRICSYDNMFLDRVGEEKTAIFVVVPPTDSTYNFIAGMLFSQLFQEIQYCALTVHKHDGQKLPVPCRFILDEFANTTKIPNFLKILAYARSLGVGIATVLQSLDQIKAMYKDEWGTIIDNSNTLLFLGMVTHEDTLKYVSSLLGKGTFDKRTSGRTHGRQGTSSLNYDVVGRELMTEAEIREMPKSDCLLFVSGKPPFYSKKYDYTSHPNYRYTSDGGAKSYEYVPALPPPAAHGERKTKNTKKAVPLIPQLVKDKEQLAEYLQKNARYYEFANTDVDDGELLSDENQQMLTAILFQENNKRNQMVNDIADIQDGVQENEDKRAVGAEREHTTRLIRDKLVVIAGLAEFAKAMQEDESAIAYADTTVDDGEAQFTESELAELTDNTIIFDEADANALVASISEFETALTADSDLIDPIIQSALGDIADVENLCLNLKEMKEAIEK